MGNFKKVEVQILTAFVDNEKGGNPAGVVLNADNLTNEQKLKVAEKVGLSAFKTTPAGFPPFSLSTKAVRICTSTFLKLPIF